MSLFGTEINPLYLIKNKQIAKEFLESDLFFIGRKDSEYNEGYKPHVMTMKMLRGIIRDNLDLSLLNLTDFPNFFGTPGQILKVNGDQDALEFVDPLSTFLELTDTPSDYTGFGGHHVMVNSGETALEFVDPVSLGPTKHEGRYTFATGVDPTLNISHINTLPTTVTPSRVSLGVFRLTFGTNVTANNLVSRINNSTLGTFSVSYNANYIEFTHRDNSGALSDPTGDISIEILLY